jgi:hypothetical protein
LAVHRALKSPRGTAHSLSFIGRGLHQTLIQFENKYIHACTI